MNVRRGFSYFMFDVCFQITFGDLNFSKMHNNVELQFFILLNFIVVELSYVVAGVLFELGFLFITRG